MGKEKVAWLPRFTWRLCRPELETSWLELEPAASSSSLVEEPAASSSLVTSPAGASSTISWRTPAPSADLLLATPSGKSVSCCFRVSRVLQSSTSWYSKLKLKIKRSAASFRFRSVYYTHRVLNGLIASVQILTKLLFMISQCLFCLYTLTDTWWAPYSIALNRQDEN